MTPSIQRTGSIHDTKKWKEFEVIDFKPKQFGDYDIDAKIEYCGVCGSDMHTLTGGWGDITPPLIVGHETAGTAVTVGPKVKFIKVGDRVGVVGSCLECNRYKSDNENYCPSMIDTYNSKFPNGDIAHGGYSTAIRAHEQFVFPIPDGLDLDNVAPMFCAGITMFSPLKRHGAGPGKTVGIVGVGAKALGSDKVVVFSHSTNKKNTADVANVPLPLFLKTLRLHGKFLIVGVPDNKFEFHTMELMGNGGSIAATHIGSKKEILEMLDLAKKKGVKSIIELYSSGCSTSASGSFFYW
ncbi:chaperonin 10-like protein [Pterulicium gracile]|uniref:Chaperonin 10-like protein n=1 Tax=Pterulicium gracile TaxID=1884261 RepID=A0A5C3Q6U4_9AGAR|nr:chaperonin 10-like protein [Pterula gracilis]